MALDSVRIFSAIVLIAAGAAACRRDQLAGDAGNSTRGVAVPSFDASSSPVPASSAPAKKGRAIAPRPGTVTSLLRPTLRVTPGVDAVELCRSRTCGAPQRVVAGADGHATPAADLDTGTWFWRVAGGKTSPPGPLWSIVIRRAAGRSSRVHGFDANGDGIADVPIEASLLLGSASALADKLTRIPYATLDAVATEAPAARSPSTLVFPVGDVDGDGFDDAVLGERLARGGPDGIRPEAEWLACPPGGCGAAAGDIDDDGYADLQGKDGLQLGSPTGFRVIPAPLLAGDPTVRAAPDLDGDGVGDLAVMSADNRTISVVRGGPQGLTLGASTSLDVPRNAGVHFEIADVDGDGLSDLVVLLSETLAGPPSSMRTTVIVRLSAPGGDISRAVERRVTWSTPAEAGMGLSAELFVADVDGDGLDDILVFFGGPHVGRARVVRGAKGALRVEPGTVGFQPSDDISGAAFFSTGDVNGDQRDDVLFVGVPSAGFTQAFDLFAGGKSGLERRPFAQYTMGANNRVPRRH